MMFLTSLSASSQAQGTGEVYAAPGMAVRLPGRINPAPAKSRPTAKGQGIIAEASPVLPRFWHQTDTARNRSAWQLYRFTNSQAKYPSNTLRAGIDGIIYVRLTVMADGSVGGAEIIRRKLMEQGGDDSYSERGRAALDTEVLRVTQILRFAPSSMRADTVIISHRFVMQ